MKRDDALQIIYRTTHADFKGKIDGVKTILVLRNGGTTLVQLDSLTDAEIIEKLPSKLAVPPHQYTEEAMALIGANMARILMLRRDPEHRNRFQTTWGSKTALGIFHTITRMVEETQEGPAKMCDDLRYENGRQDT